MFDDIIKKIQSKEYSEAKDALDSLITKGESEDDAYAYYLLGYIYTRYDNPEKNNQIAKRYLRRNLTSEHPHPYAYYLFARVEEDRNVALNYLNIGVSTYPQNPAILRELLRLSPDKESAIRLIDNSNPTDSILLGQVISHFIYEHQWARILPYLAILNDRKELYDDEKAFLGLLHGYSLIFGEIPSYNEAECIFHRIIVLDKDNDLAYAHYLGLIYAYIKEGKNEEATSFFDRLPVNNTIYDFSDRPWPFEITAILECEYASIFETIENLFSRDNIRKLKAEALFALYLYNPSEDYGTYRYKKADAAVLLRFLKYGFNTQVACALYHMRLHFMQYKEAFKVLCDYIRNYESWEDDIYYFPFELAKKAELIGIADYAVECLKEDDFDTARFVELLFDNLIDALHKSELFAQVRLVSDCISDSAILKSNCAFECAYAYGKTEHSRATKLYEGLVEKEPNNSAATNNLGVRYEQSGDLFSALSCFEKAYMLDKSNERSKNNSERVKKNIQQNTDIEIKKVARALSTKSLDGIGFNLELQRKILNTQDAEMRNILTRDLKECAIAVVTGQDKMATIMCGSIIEALLMQRIREKNIEKYDISQISNGKRATSYPVVEMGLNELLFVADQEKIIDKSSYHLGHFIRDYRNIVHPAKEKRMSEDVNHDNVLTMWAVLKRLLDELY